METNLKALHSLSDLSNNVLGQLVHLSKWSNLYSFLLDCGYKEDFTGTEKQAKRALRDLDTYLMALYLCDNYCISNEPFTLRALAKAMNGEDFNSIKSQEKKLRLLFERLERFNIINTYRDTHKGQRECWRIEAKPNLIKFMQSEFI